jgi:hypothetical protein
MLAATEGMLAVTEGTLPMTEGMLPVTGDMLWATEGKLAVTEGMLLVTEGMLPMTDDMLPMTGDMLWATEGRLPVMEGMLPMTGDMLRATESRLPMTGIKTNLGGDTMRKTVCALLILLAAPAAADTLLTYTRTSPELESAAGHEGGREPIRILVGANRVRLEEPRFTAILRQDEQKIYFLSGSTYSVIKLPVDAKQALSPELYQSIWGEHKANPLPVTSKATGKAATVGRWKAREHRLEIDGVEPRRFASGGTSRLTASVWTTDQLAKALYARVGELKLDIASLHPARGGRELAEALAALPGVPVKIVITQRGAEGEVRITEELTSVEEKSATDADYLPAPYAQSQEFDIFYTFAYHRF